MSEEREGRYLGIIEPALGGRWTWPFRHWVVGDYFHVAHEHRDPNEVQNIARVRSSQLCKGVTVKTNDPEKPGFCRLECRPYGEREKGARTTAALEYGVARERVLDWYGLNLDEINIGPVEHGVEIAVEPLFIDDDAGERMVFKMHTLTVGMEREGDKLRFVRLPDGWTLKVWLKLYDKWKEERNPQGKSDDELLFDAFKLEARTTREDLRVAVAKLDLQRLKADPVAYRAKLREIKGDDLKEVMS